MAAVHPLRPAAPEPPGDSDRVNVVRLVEFLGPISPELVLVDPDLAPRARALLPELPWNWQPGGRALDEPVSLQIETIRPATTSRWRLAAVSALAAVAGVFFGLGWSAGDATSRDGAALRSQPPVAEPAADATVPQPPPAPTAPSSGSKAPSAPRFVWPVEPRADGYRLALFRGGRLIFERDVTEPGLQLPLSWTFKGRFESLKRGTYRWVVWPYFGRLKLLGPAIVSARYVV